MPKNRKGRFKRVKTDSYIEDKTENTKTAIQTPFKLDLRGEVCPAPFIKTKVKIESMPPGEILEVTVSGEAVETIPRGMKEDGHKIVGVEREDNGVFRFYIQKSYDQEQTPDNEHPLTGEIT